MATHELSPIRFVAVVLAAATFFYGTDTQAQVRPPDADQPRVALAFSVGGSRGWAFVGVIKALEEARIDVEIVTGVSMGCVVGSLYATGRFSAADLEQIALSRDWAALMRDGVERRQASVVARITTMPWISIRANGARPAMPGMSRGNGFTTELTRYLWNELRVSDMRQLPRALSCLAIDVEEPEAAKAVIVLDSGSIVLNARASAALPIIFDPVWIGGRLLADGGLIRAIGVSEAHDLGADVVIGIDLSQNLQPGHGCRSPICSLIRIPKLQRYRDRDAQRAEASIVIEPDVSHIPITDFSRVAETIQIGYEATMAKIDSIRAIVEAATALAVIESHYGPAGSASANRKRPEPVSASPMLVTGCRVQWGVPRADSRKFRFGSMRREIEAAFGCPNATITREGLISTLDDLRSTNHFNHISARFENGHIGTTLVVDATPHPGATFGVSLGRGLHGPWGSIAWTHRSAKRGQFLRVSGFKRELYRVRADYMQALRPNMFFWGMADYSSVPSGMKPSYYLPAGYDFVRARAALVLTGQTKHALSIGILGAKDVTKMRAESAADATANVVLLLDSVDKTAFATRGTHFWYRYRRSLVNKWWSHTFDMRGYVPVGKQVSLLFGLAGEYVAVDRSQLTREERTNPASSILPTLTLAFVEPLGGANLRNLSFGQFVGIGRGEVATSFMQTAMIGVQGQVSSKWTAMLRANAAAISDALDGRLSSDRVVIGGGVTMVRRTMFGPVSATLGASNLTGFRPMLDIGIGLSL